MPNGSRTTSFPQPVGSSGFSFSRPETIPRTELATEVVGGVSCGASLSCSGAGGTPALPAPASLDEVDALIRHRFGASSSLPEGLFIFFRPRRQIESRFYVCYRLMIARNPSTTPWESTPDLGHQNRRPQPDCTLSAPVVRPRHSHALIPARPHRLRARLAADPLPRPGPGSTEPLSERTP